MPISIRAVGDDDFFAWIGLFAGYCAFYETEFSDEKALVVWQWLSDPANPLQGLVAEDDGALVGLAHYREVPSTLDARTGLFLDDLFVAPERRTGGIGAGLIEAVRTLAAERGAVGVQWITAADNSVAQSLYEKLAERTSWVTYEMPV